MRTHPGAALQGQEKTRAGRSASDRGQADRCTIWTDADAGENRRGLGGGGGSCGYASGERSASRAFDATLANGRFPPSAIVNCPFPNVGFTSIRDVAQKSQM